MFRERLYPYTSCLLFIVVFFIAIHFDYLPKLEDGNIQDLANIIITITAIFMSFLGVGLSLLHQNPDNTNIVMLKKNGKYNLFLRYFKEALIISIGTIIFSIFMSLGFYINNITFTIFLGFIFLVITLNYRIIHYLFKVLEE